MSQSIVAGDKAPEFTLLDDKGQTVSSQDLAGQAYILYFYPKASTPGCTTEALGFRDHLEDFAKLGYRVLGVSRDSVKAQCNFVTKQGLTFPLLSDKEEVLCNAYDVIKDKVMCGKPCRGIQRSTFVVDAQGVVTHALRDVKAKTHVEELLALLQG